jgi:hypothetical protein
MVRRSTRDRCAIGELTAVQSISLGKGMPRADLIISNIGAPSIFSCNSKVCDRYLELTIVLIVHVPPSAAISLDMDCMMAANGAITWHIARIMYDIDLHRKQRESASKSHVQSFSRPSRVLDGLLCCVFFGVHLIYRERLEQVHPARRVSLADFRRFIQEVLLEWSGKSMLGWRLGRLFTYLHADVNLLVSQQFAHPAGLDSE